MGLAQCKTGEGLVSDELVELHTRLTEEGGAVNPEAFAAFVGLPELPWFAQQLAAVYATGGEGAEVSHSVAEGGVTLSLAAFGEGIANTCRGKRASALHILFNASRAQQGTEGERSPSSDPPLREGGDGVEGRLPEGVLDKRGLARVFTLTHAAGRAAWGHPVELAQFKASRMAAALLAHIASMNASDAVLSGGGSSSSIGGGGGGGITFDQFAQWAAEEAPFLHHALGTYMQRRCFPDDKLPPSAPKFETPRLLQPSSVLSGLGPELLGLAIGRVMAQGPWVRLFTSDEDGLSFNRLCHSIMGYGGPSLLVLRDRVSGAVLGGVASDTWRELNTFYGGSESFLFQLSPSFRVCQSKPASERNYMYLNLKTKVLYHNIIEHCTAEGNYMYLNLKGFSLPHGLGMGGTRDNFRFFIPESFDAEASVAKSNCMTFEPGELCPSANRRFEIDSLEVWGLGGEEAVSAGLDARMRHRAAVAHTLNKARKVDKAKFLDNEFDREFLLGKTFNGGGGGGGKGENRYGNA
ncbi:TLD-domain-containing protein [Tribonema minus]|uniref:TLD-domain-containing protein n=1 Tax=Tribonema minus TaxID=303371 RepID=A0A835YL28_9STRA|nr:TLD-domain-containing protein [Tribonema minus]